jgi:DNA helicase HerA-like ATPase
VTLIEESQNIVPYRDRTQEPSLFEKMFFEMRKYGESLVLVAQFPSQVFPDIVKSAGVKVVHRMTETADSGVAMDLMGLNRRMYSQLKHLPVGRALVLTDLNEEPLTVQFPEFSPSSRNSFADFTTSANPMAS